MTALLQNVWSKRQALVLVLSGFLAGALLTYVVMSSGSTSQGVKINPRWMPTGCCAKMAASGRPCQHRCCITATAAGTVCLKCNVKPPGGWTALRRRVANWIQP